MIAETLRFAPELSFRASGKETTVSSQNSQLHTVDEMLVYELTFKMYHRYASVDREQHIIANSQPSQCDLIKPHLFFPYSQTAIGKFSVNNLSPSQNTIPKILSHFHPSNYDHKSQADTGSHKTKLSDSTKPAPGTW